MTISPRYTKLLKESWSLTWPILVIMAFDLGMNLTDVIVAGFLGKETQAAVGLANQTYFIFTVVVNALTVGTIAVISRTFGSTNRERDLPNAIYTAVAFAAACSIIVTLIAFVAAPLIISNLNTAPEVKQRAVVFIRLYCAGLFFHLMVIHFNGVLRACKMILYSMKVLVFISILNIILNIILVFYTPVGYGGIALSTALCWMIGFALIGRAIYALIWRNWQTKLIFIKDTAKKILKISWPSAIVVFSWQFSSLALFTIIGSLPVNSVETMAAMTAGLRIESIIFMPAFAFNMANAVLVGNLLGENKPEDAFSMGLVTAALAVGVISLLTVLVIAFAGPIANMLASKNENGVVDPVVVREIIIYLHIVMLSEPLVAAHLAFGGALNGSGDTKSVMKYTLFSLWVVRIPVAYFFGVYMGFGAIAVWWAMNFTFLSQSLLSGRRFFSKKWITSGIFKS